MRFNTKEAPSPRQVSGRRLLVAEGVALLSIAYACGVHPAGLFKISDDGDDSSVTLSTACEPNFLRYAPKGGITIKIEKYIGTNDEERNTTQKKEGTPYCVVYKHAGQDVTKDTRYPRFEWVVYPNKSHPKKS